MNKSHKNFKDILVEQLEENKADEICVVDLQGKTSFADYMIIASGRSSRHINAIASNLVEVMKNSYNRTMNIEGLGQSDWVLIDADEVIVHVFHPEAREKYSIEKIWGF